MKKCFLAALIILIAASANSQQGAMDYIMLGDVTDFAAFNKPVRSVIVSDTLRGGTFNLYKGPDAADNGMVFMDAIGRKWQRAVSGNTINTKWYGMKAYTLGLTDAQNDSHSRFMAAVNYVYKHKQFSTVYIPHDESGQKVYYFMSTVVLDRDITITGDYAFNNPVTSIIWRGHHTIGFKLLPTYAAHISLQNLNLTQDFVTSGYDSNAHIIYSSTFIHLKNINIPWASGDGVRIEACADKGSPIFGNADHSIIENLQTYACMNGLYMKGCDANVISIVNSSFVYNRRWGTYDDGMLGNYYQNCHYSANGKQGGVIVTYKGKYYVPVDGPVNMGKQPDSNPAYWYEVEPMGGAEVWDNSKKYYSGGVAIIKNPNAFSSFEHTYSESYQPPVILNARTSYNGGVAGGAVKGGVFTRVLEGNYIINTDATAGTQVTKLGVGTAPVSGQSWMVDINALDGNVMRLRTKAPSSNLVFTNADNNEGAITYYQGSFLFATKQAGITAALDKDGLYPYGFSNKFSLGKPDLKWKDAWVKNYNGEKINIATGSNASAGTAVLSRGTVTVNTTSVTAASLIFVVYNTPSGTLAAGLSAPSGSIKPGVSFVINSLTTTGGVNVADNSSVRWWIIN